MSGGNGNSTSIESGHKARLNNACKGDLADANPVFCLCSSGMFENLFAPFCRGAVRVEIVKAMGLGDECCEFVVHFDV